ncbi:GntR family transcriptional regulator [Granulosicoccus sp. 3-233]|uniref:GntR family transcriptional regulator n=1 Tax=Granulosicoccus sp. 3-233 TaxID=3417969 RepID=UPI003D34A080
MHSHQIDKIKTPSALSDIAADAIRNAIVTGQYELGAPLSENALSEATGISKTPIRDALAQLRHEGLVRIVPRKGTFVFTLSVDDVAQLGRYRYLLESAALELSWRHNEEALLQALRKTCEEMTLAHGESDLASYLAIDGRFHQELVSFCDNDFLLRGYKGISSQVAAIRTHLSQYPEHTDKSKHEHFEILRLLQNRSIEEAKQVLERHVTRGERTFAAGTADITAAGRDGKKTRGK